MIHGGDDPVTEIGAGATIGHLCVVHGCWIGAEALIGNGSTVQDGARIGARCLVGAGATVPPNTVVPDEQLVLGPVSAVRGPPAGGAAWVTRPEVYQELARRHRAGIGPAIAGGPAPGDDPHHNACLLHAFRIWLCHATSAMLAAHPADQAVDELGAAVVGLLRTWRCLTRRGAESSRPADRAGDGRPDRRRTSTG